MGPLDFKFSYVSGATSSGFFGVPEGRVGDDALEVGDFAFEYEEIADTVTRGDRLALQFVEEAIDREGRENLRDSVVVLEPRDISPLRLETLIDQRSSAARLEQRRRQLREQGREHLIR